MPVESPWTTIMTWDWFGGKLTHRGSEYFSKSAEFERFWDLPRRANRPLTLAINGMKAPLKKIADEGWRPAGCA